MTLKKILLITLTLLLIFAQTSCDTGFASMDNFTVPLDCQEFKNFVIIGDSITQGEDWHNGYRYYLWQSLVEEDCNFDFVGSMDTNAYHPSTPAWSDYKGQSFDRDHEGHWGWRADEIDAMMETWLIDYSPDVALLHIGTNDAFQEQSPESTVDDIISIINKIRADNPNVISFVAQVIPAEDTARNDRIDLLNAAITTLPDLASTEQSPIYIVDQNSDFDVNDLHDGIHPDESGDQFMGAVWFEALEDNLY